MEITKIFQRQLGLVVPRELDFPILVIGAGGIGSWATLALAKMGCQDIHVVDYDTVDVHNIPSQLYTPEQIGKPKVEALKEVVEYLTETEITPINEKFSTYYDGDYVFPKVIICAVDSLEQRRSIWELIIKDWFSTHDFDFYIDARMGGELLRILAINPHESGDLNYYQGLLFNQKTTPSVEPCTEKSIVYNTFICGGIIASLVKKYAKQEEYKVDMTFDIVGQTTI